MLPLRNKRTVRVGAESEARDQAAKANTAATMMPPVETTWPAVRRHGHLGRRGRSAHAYGAPPVRPSASEAETLRHADTTVSLTGRTR